MTDNTAIIIIPLQIMCITLRERIGRRLQTVVLNEIPNVPHGDSNHILLRSSTNWATPSDKRKRTNEKREPHRVMMRRSASGPIDCRARGLRDERKRRNRNIFDTEFRTFEFNLNISFNVGFIRRKTPFRNRIFASRELAFQNFYFRSTVRLTVR